MTEAEIDAVVASAFKLEAERIAKEQKETSTAPRKRRGAGVGVGF